MSIPTPPAHGATNWDTWLVDALNGLDSSVTQNSTNLQTVINLLNALQASIDSLTNQVNNSSGNAVAVWQ